MNLQALRIDGATSSPGSRRGTTIVFAWQGDDTPAIVYLGTRLADGIDLVHFAHSRIRPLPHGTLDVIAPIHVSPEQGTGFMGHPGLVANRDVGGWGGRLSLVDHEHDPQGVIFHMADRERGISLATTFEIDGGTDVVVARSTLTNDARSALQVDWLAAAAIPVPDHLTQRLRFQGRWCGEFDAVRETVRRGLSVDENRRGRTSHEAFPGTFLVASSTTSGSGPALGAHIAWSGNHRLLVERMAEGQTQLQAGTLLMPGELVLSPGQSLTTPDLFLAHSSKGTNGASQKFHEHVRRRILDWPDAKRPRPVTVNTWEAIYFDHRLDKLKSLADEAAAIGAERFVLDDGWFGGERQGRDDDTSSLGDWYVDPRKYPDGLHPLVDHVKGLGLEFGLWVEPEMVNRDSDLFRAHPDWALALPAYEQVLGRNQMVLDLTNESVFAYLLERLSALLSEYAIGYLKWDMNRSLVLPADAQGQPVGARQTAALYALLDAVRHDFPKVEIESCASGGARIDFEVLERTHRFWASDSNDPVERMRIQTGFSHFLPPEVMGSHVGPAWCHTTGRGTSSTLRSLVASWGHFGMELDLTAIDDEEREVLSAAVERHKRDRDIWHKGRLYRLDHPDTSLMAVMAERDGRGAVVAAQLDRPRDTIPVPLRLQGLDAEATYRVVREVGATMGYRAFHNPIEDLDSGIVLPGHVLMEAGLQLPVMYAQTALGLALEKVA